MDIELKKIDYSNQDLLKKILDWRNDETTRQFSNNQHIITSNIFVIILKKYKDSGIDPLIIYSNNIEIGIISFVENNNKIYIGININPQYRDMKIGSKALEFFLCKKKELINDNITVIYASVKKENIRSIKLFDKYFRSIEENDSYKEFYLDI